ncbi:hypothetical protein GCM10012275_21550 [Longimycelium tulufanense]|uniref:Uncharacterized protein n=1 Tax=Longimycelium tulufanense TaxID=907463 RepID=A0A8J3CD82_9PSEU|nr:helix-turn-helix transcriptional regulator [Longimycelium tulufanense]GGM50366.1 hypothetical protein GCM10012275_21550 [Longimycelium tulufanense]
MGIAQHGTSSVVEPARARTLAQVRDRELAQALRTGPFPVALRAAIKHRGLGLERIQHRLRQHGVQVSLTTLSYWQRGRSRPERAESMRAVRVLERVLGLPPDSLISLLGPPRPRGRWVSAAGTLGVDQLWDDHARLADLLAAVDIECYERTRAVSVRDQFFVGPDGAERRSVVTQAIRAEADRVDRCLAIYHSDSPAQSLPAGIDVRYGRLGRVRTDVASGYCVLEIVLDRVLDTGDVAILEYELHFPGGAERVRCYDRRLRGVANEYILQVHFDSARLPVRCHRYRQRHIGAPQEDVSPLWIGTSHTAHIVLPEAPPGVHGICWEWE